MVLTKYIQDGRHFEVQFLHIFVKPSEKVLNDLFTIKFIVTCLSLN